MTDCHLIYKDAYHLFNLLSACVCHDGWFNMTMSCESLHNILLTVVHGAIPQSQADNPNHKIPAPAINPYFCIYPVVRVLAVASEWCSNNAQVLLIQYVTFTLCT